MPHLSRAKTNTTTTTKLENLFVELIEETGPRTRRAIIQELLTRTERTMLAKRLGLLLLINRMTPTHTIEKTLKMSPSTVARFEASVARKAYSKTCAWLNQPHIQNRVMRSLFKLFSLPFTRPYKSVKPLLPRIND